MSNEFAHDVAMEWARAHAEAFKREPVEFGLKAAQVYLAADVVFSELPKDLPAVTARLAALSALAEKPQLPEQTAARLLAEKEASCQVRSAGAEGSV